MIAWSAVRLRKAGFPKDFLVTRCATELLLRLSSEDLPSSDLEIARSVDQSGPQIVDRVSLWSPGDSITAQLLVDRPDCEQ